MPAAIGPDPRPVLVVGATGDLGGRVVRALLSRSKRVRALVRPGSDTSHLPKEGVEIVRGDMLDPASLPPAMTGVSAVISTAIGYSRRRRGDSLRTDFDGNRNLVDAAKQTAVPRFVFLSILACDQAPEVPHFWAKKLTEDLLQSQQVPFVALRPGAFLYAPPGRYGEWMLSALKKNQVMGMTPAGTRITYIDPDEVARALAMAVDEPRALGQRIDLGSDRALSGPELADLVGRLLGRPIGVRQMGGGFMMRLLALFSPGLRGMQEMGRFFQTGKYVADTRVQAELFGPVPKIEDAARKVLVGFGLLPA
ncbi:MAG TPA: SDR family oxidoreductase [Thermoplasmata archaeon]|nr:SDR family oxidoreductase [Thermoplasmata archaeon]